MSGNEREKIMAQYYAAKRQMKPEGQKWAFRVK